MTRTLAAVAIAVLAAAWCAPAASDEPPQVPVPARYECVDGRVVAVTALIPVAGVLRFSFPPGVCDADPAPSTPPKVDPPRRTASMPARST